MVSKGSVIDFWCKAEAISKAWKPGAISKAVENRKNP
jgi:hypothetical protein